MFETRLFLLALVGLSPTWDVVSSVGVDLEVGSDVVGAGQEVECGPGALAGHRGPGADRQHARGGGRGLVREEGVGEHGHGVDGRTLGRIRAVNEAS